MLKIVADDKIPFLKGVLDPFAEVVYLPGAAVGPEHVKDADALITRTRTRCNEALLAGSSVRFIASATIGFDHIDAAFCEANNVQWTNAPGCNSSSVAQYMASALLSLAEMKRVALSDLTLGIVGVGNVGSKVARVAKTLGMQVLLNDPPRARTEPSAEHFVSLEEVQKQADVITFHVPLNREGEDKTLHLADQNFCTKVKPGCWILNTSRGPVVDNVAAKEALQQERIQALVLDVWENEPGIDLALLESVDFGTPHIAGYSADGKANGTAMSVQAVSRCFDLPLKNWTPTDVPEPESTTVYINGQGKKTQTVVAEAVRFSYDVSSDDKRLRAAPETFEALRGDYPLRREFPVFHVEVTNAPSGAREALLALGFNL